MDKASSGEEQVPDPQVVTQAVVGAIRDALELTLGAAIANGRFDERVQMVLAEGMQVVVGEQKLWVNVYVDGDERVQHLAAAAVVAAREECEEQARRLEARMPDGSMVWKDGDILAQGARHCAAYVSVTAPERPYMILNRLKKLEADAATLRDVSNAYAKLVTDNPKAQNYVEAVLIRASDDQEFVVTIRRREGKTPHEIMVDRDERWRAAVSGLLAMEPELKSTLAQLARMAPAELTPDGVEAQKWAAELTELMKRKE
jgi:hypothetical protein